MLDLTAQITYLCTYKGNFRSVPVMLGSNREEGLIFTGAYLKNETMFEVWEHPPAFLSGLCSV